MRNKTIKFFTDIEDQGKRLDIILSEKIPDYSRSFLKKIIENQNVKVDNKVISSPSKIIKAENKIEISFKIESQETVKPKKIKLKIIYEDNDVLIINKPSGMVVHPGAGNYTDTLVNALIYKYKKNLSNINGPVRPGIVHRIDKETSGLLVIAKNNFSHSFLSKQFSDHTIKRTYVALVWGVLRPLNGKIKTFIQRNKKNRKLMSTSEKSGKLAITNYKTLKIFNLKNIPKISMVKFNLETGRTHQIRVHMSYKGNNILGDKTYKKKFKSIKNVDEELAFLIKNTNRQFLHAKLIGLRHPSSGKYVEFKTNLPKDLNNILKKLRKMQN